MKIEYILTTHTKEEYPKDDKKNDVVIIGRSNVGKSSLINAMGHSKKLAKTSRHPGKTKALSFFNVDDKFFLVDIPGFGYAKVSKYQFKIFNQIIDEYFTTRKTIKSIILLLDIRRKISQEDLEIIDFLKSKNFPIIYGLTKIDKVNQSEKRHGINHICQVLEINEKEIVLISSFKKIGLNQLKLKIYETL